ncbi:ANTAR domain-containing protein, partial [Actinomadura napierensis]|uniref:ANTAR domain-containing protein n=1 Tax=Actinomadura napierensis TaxID=267854 RepID=UPI0031D1412E
MRHDRDAARPGKPAPEPGAVLAAAVVEQAKGMLAERFGCGVEAAYDHLLELASDSGMEPETAAALLLGADPDVPGGHPAHGGVPEPRTAPDGGPAALGATAQAAEPAADPADPGDPADL